MPHLRRPDERGDLYATVRVRLPSRLSDEERSLFERLRALRPA
jgi:curved DNA-binding protein